MREILEDAVLLAWREAESLLLLVVPVIIISPVLIIVAGSGLIAGLVTVPIFVLLYLLSYALCIRGAGSLLENVAPEPLPVLLDVVTDLPSYLRIMAPAGFVLAVSAACSLVAGDQGFGLIALAIGFLGVAAAAWWQVRHAYEPALVLLHGTSADDAQEVGPYLADATRATTAPLVAAVTGPALVALLLSWGIGAATGPALGAIVLAIAVALWLPFAAAIFAVACDRLINEVDPARQSARAVAG